MKQNLQKYLGKARTILKIAKISFGNFVFSLKNFAKPFAKNEETLYITDTSHQNTKGRGFFSLFLEILYIISVNSEKNINVDYHQTDYNDNPDENIWEYCFEPVCNNTENKKPYRYLFTTQPYKNSFADKKRYRNLFHQVITDRIIIKNKIQQKISDFFAEKFAGSKIIGVHYRGADTLYKINLQPKRELKKAPIDEYFAEIDALLEKGFEKIFLATDDAEAHQKFIERYGNKIIYISATRSSKQGAIYDWGRWRTNIPLLKTDKRLLCEEALIDSVLLSKCDYLIHGQSNLSRIAMYFNPAIPLKNMELPDLNLIQKIENSILYF